ncbi:palmitoyltransferase ZDHHC16A isoform X2 [Oncorhynchus tshawytscha]|uniref:palmitoyltransferase ZDHHC16A isoform X2 n=1 Tax=Oncorhynchus tshawytscha TaxID=74940 RepID=UPI000D0A298A|nr:palmitoyltransferase ZDHHC16A isoform X2 [Oncorhynchus tshawytscha]XP_024280118.1 palmitoyltransferase ZDHHC16A isoform X2 [Oncorhynchus tshawytscha]
MRLCPTFLLQRWLWLCVCARQWHCRNGNNCRLPLCVRQIWAYLRLMVDSLYYNTLTNSDVVMDSLMEPILWMVDLLTRRFGAVFVCLLVILTTSILLVVYVVMLPVIFDTYSPSWIAWHMSYGHWNLVMIVFHYYKATNTAPGYPPTMKNSIPFVSMCKKCIIPKPARTHHCAICNTCILKMDHHCPWLNNCVGHFNQRYFFCFCVSLTLGCVYCSISGRNLFLDAYSAYSAIEVHTDSLRETWVCWASIIERVMVYFNCLCVQFELLKCFFCLSNSWWSGGVFLRYPESASNTWTNQVSR